MNLLAALSESHDIIVFGGVVFWVLVGLFLVIEQLSVTYNGYKFATISFLVFAILMAIFLQRSAVRSIVSNWQLVGMMAIGYFVIGTMWGIIKWWMYASKRARIYEDIRDEFYTKYKIDKTKPAKELSLNDLSLLLESVVSQYNKEFWEYKGYYFKLTDVIPRAKDHKPIIMGWMCWWVFSLLDTVLRDMVKDIFNAIYRSISKMLQRIADRCFGKYKADF